MRQREKRNRGDIQRIPRIRDTREEREREEEGEKKDRLKRKDVKCTIQPNKKKKKTHIFL